MKADFVVRDVERLHEPAGRHRVHASDVLGQEDAAAWREVPLRQVMRHPASLGTGAACLTFSSLRGRLGSLHATPASAVTYRVGVVDVTDGKTFANLTTVRFG